MMRFMEVLLDSGTQLNGWQTRYFITAPTKLSSRLPAKSKLPATRPIRRSNTSSNSCLPENYAR